MRMRSRISMRWARVGMAACALLMGPVHAQNRQTSPEGQLACQALDQTSGIPPALAAAMGGEAQGFPKLAQHLDALQRLMNDDQAASLKHLTPLLAGIEHAGKNLLQKKELVLTVQNSLRALIRQSLALIGQAQEVATSEAQLRQARTRVNAAQQLPALLDRLARHAGKIAADGSPEAIFNLSQDLNTFMTLVRGLTEGNTELKLAAASSLQQRARLQKLTEDFTPIRASAGQVLGKLHGYAGVHDSVQHIQKVSGELALGLQRMCYMPGIRIEPRT